MARLRVTVLAFFSSVSSALVQSLDTAGGSASWVAHSVNGSVAVPAVVPGQVHLDLLRAGIIGEPYAELHVDTEAWVKATPWILTASFLPSPALLASPRVELVAEGIDTVANVSFNGVFLWSQDDAFVRTVVDVTNVLLHGGATNTLTVVLASPTLAALAAAAACEGFCPSPEWGPPPNRSSYDQGFAYVRKPAVHFGWDFAPNHSPSGIWRSIFLRGFNAAVLEDVTVVTTPVATIVPFFSPAAWRADITAHIAVRGDGTTGVTVSAFIEGLGAAGRGSTHALLTANNDGVVTVSLYLPAVAAWWPQGLGAATLYNATVTLIVDTTGETSSQALRLGFRHVSLERPPAPDGNGTLYGFLVNGRAFFVKGANWVPADAFYARVSAPAQILPKLRSFVAANFNTLRVWGGGHPQETAFYEAADELGLFIWQEMPFACAGYPTGADMLANVARETQVSIRRLQKHAILLWGGNNEIAQIQHYPVGSTGAGNYSALFFGAVGDNILAMDASRSFVPSSPGSGGETAAAPIAVPPVSTLQGDDHVYVYDGNCWDPVIFPRPRAASEFGWQSYSNLASMAEVLGPEGFDFWSPPVQRRDTHGSQPPATILFHNVGSNWRIPGYNDTTPRSDPGLRDARLTGAAAAAAADARTRGATSTAYTQRSDGSFALPTDALGIVPMMSAYGGGGAARGSIFRDTLLLTQLSQAACYKVEAELYRRLQSQCEGGGCTSTILYWMAADLWPAATKGSIEWSGRWKALHYEAAAHFLAPLLLSPWTSPSAGASAPFGVVIAAHPPAAVAIPSGVLVTTCWSWADGRLGESHTPFSITAWPSFFGVGSNVSAGGSVSVLDTTLTATLASCGCAPPRTPAECVLTVEAFSTPSPTPSSLLASNSLYVAPLKDVLTMRDPQLAITDVVSTSPGAFEVTLTARHLPVATVWIESLLCCGYFSANGFLMTASPTVLRYTPNADARGWAHAPPPGAEFNVTAGQFAASLSVWSLWDTATGYGAAVAA